MYGKNGCRKSLRSPGTTFYSQPKAALRNKSEYFLYFIHPPLDGYVNVLKRLSEISEIVSLFLNEKNLGTVRKRKRAKSTLTRDVERNY